MHFDPSLEEALSLLNNFIENYVDPLLESSTPEDIQQVAPLATRVQDFRSLITAAPELRLRNAIPEPQADCQQASQQIQQASQQASQQIQQASQQASQSIQQASQSASQAAQQASQSASQAIQQFSNQASQSIAAASRSVSSAVSSASSAIASAQSSADQAIQRANQSMMSAQASASSAQVSLSLEKCECGHLHPISCLTSKFLTFLCIVGCQFSNTSGRGCSGSSNGYVNTLLEASRSILTNHIQVLQLQQGHPSSPQQQKQLKVHRFL
jgi:vacuolar-type H+-ATPase subunit H